jgi:hypothetical protein
MSTTPTIAPTTAPATQPAWVTALKASAASMIWLFQYGLIVPGYWVWRLLARSGWTILAVFTLGISALIRGYFKKAGRTQRALLAAATGETDKAEIDTYRWRKITRPWLIAWVKGETA